MAAPQTMNGRNVLLCINLHYKLFTDGFAADCFSLMGVRQAQLLYL